jgi:hypothetical protein
MKDLHGFCRTKRGSAPRTPVSRPSTRGAGTPRRLHAVARLGAAAMFLAVALALALTEARSSPLPPPEAPHTKPAPPAVKVPPDRAPAPPALLPPGSQPNAPDEGSANPPAQPTIALDEVKVGQRGYGLSVFAGGRPERFEVEVIGVMRNISPDMSYILARLSGHGLETSGVAAGMSGSPVFLDGRLAGAVAFGWPFAKEAIGGITPIALMRRLPTLGGPAPAIPPPPVELSDLLAGRIPADLLRRELAKLRPRLGGVPEGAVAGIEWSTSGFGEVSQGVLRQALGSVAPAGRSPSAADRGGILPRPAAGSAPLAPNAPNAPNAPGAVAILDPGSAVAAVLVDGDFQLAATGTVTDHFGDHVLAFGHPFLGLGPIRVPMAQADVVTVLSSQYTSFKISNIGDVVGAFEQDRQAGIVGRLGAAAPMIPMTLRIAGAGPSKAREFRVRLANVPELLPMLAGSTTLAGLESASYAAGAQSIDLTARFRLARYGELTVHQTFDGENAGTAGAAHLLSVAAYLMQNPLERVGIQEIEVELRQSPQPRGATLVGAQAERSVVRPGETVTVHLDLAAYRGERFRHSFELPLPADLPAGRYALLIGDGASADAARLSLAPIEPVAFGQALGLLRSLHSRRDLAVLGVTGGAGLSVAGELMPHLPASVRSLWGAAAAGSALPLRSVIAQELHETMPMPIEGLLRLDLEVRHQDATPAGRQGPAGQGGARAGSLGDGDGEE